MAQLLNSQSKKHAGRLALLRQVAVDVGELPSHRANSRDMVAMVGVFGMRSSGYNPRLVVK